MKVCSLWMIALLWLPLLATTTNALTKTKTVKTGKKLKKVRTTTTTTAVKKKKKTTTSLTSSLLGGSKPYLYENDAHVIEYMGDEDTDFKQSRMAKIVQFYSPLCVSARQSNDNIISDRCWNNGIVCSSFFSRLVHILLVFYFYNMLRLRSLIV